MYTYIHTYIHTMIIILCHERQGNVNFPMKIVNRNSEPGNLTHADLISIFHDENYVRKLLLGNSKQCHLNSISE